jgi:hypothetical protein
VPLLGSPGPPYSVAPTSWPAPGGPSTTPAPAAGAEQLALAARLDRSARMATPMAAASPVADRTSARRPVCLRRRGDERGTRPTLPASLPTESN